MKKSEKNSGGRPVKYPIPDTPERLDPDSARRSFPTACTMTR